MASLLDMRRRIKSVKNTQQITKAMKMVAAAKLKHLPPRSRTEAGQTSRCHRDHRSPKCRQIFAHQFNFAQRARHCKRAAGNNARQRRYFLRAGRSEVSLYRHGGNPPARQTFQLGRSLQRDARGAQHPPRRPLRVDCRSYNRRDGARQAHRRSDSKSAQSRNCCFKQMGFDQTKTQGKADDRATRRSPFGVRSTHSRSTGRVPPSRDR